MFIINIGGRYILPSSQKGKLRLEFGPKVTKLAKQLNLLPAPGGPAGRNAAFPASSAPPGLRPPATAGLQRALCSPSGMCIRVATGCPFPASTYLLKCQAALSFIFLTISIVRVSAICCLALAGIGNRCCYRCHQPHCKSLPLRPELPPLFLLSMAPCTNWSLSSLLTPRPLGGFCMCREHQHPMQGSTLFHENKDQSLFDIAFLFPLFCETIFVSIGYIRTISTIKTLLRLFSCQTKPGIQRVSED